MSKMPHLISDPDAPMIYQICVRGHLGGEWQDWFEGLDIIPQANGDTLLTGLVIDQAALFGLLKKVRDFGMPLISVMRMTLNETESSDITP